MSTASPDFEQHAFEQPQVTPALILHLGMHDTEERSLPCHDISPLDSFIADCEAANIDTDDEATESRQNLVLVAHSFVSSRVKQYLTGKYADLPLSSVPEALLPEGIFERNFSRYYHSYDTTSTDGVARGLIQAAQERYIGLAHMHNRNFPQITGAITLGNLLEKSGLQIPARATNELLTVYGMTLNVLAIARKQRHVF